MKAVYSIIQGERDFDPTWLAAMAAIVSIVALLIF